MKWSCHDRRRQSHKQRHRRRISPSSPRGLHWQRLVCSKLPKGVSTLGPLGFAHARCGLQALELQQTSTRGTILRRQLARALSQSFEEFDESRMVGCSPLKQ